MSVTSIVGPRTLKIAAAALFLLPFASALHAATATSTFSVQMTVTSSCVINSTATLNFGSQGVLVANVNGTSALAVQCTSTTPYNIGLDQGQGSGATVAARKMTNGPNTITYTLLQRHQPHRALGQYRRDQHGGGHRQRRLAELHHLWPGAAAEHADSRRLHRYGHGDRYLLMVDA